MVFVWNPSGTQVEPKWNPSGTKMEPQDRLGKYRIDKVRIGDGREMAEPQSAVAAHSASPPPPPKKYFFWKKKKGLKISPCKFNRYGSL